MHRKTPEWITEAREKRRGNTSSIVIVETADEGRFRELIAWHQNLCGACGKATKPLIVDEAEGPSLQAACLSCGRAQSAHLIIPNPIYEGLGVNIQASRIEANAKWRVARERLLVLTPFKGLREWKLEEDEQELHETQVPIGSFRSDPLMEEVGITDAHLRTLFAQVHPDEVPVERLVEENRIVAAIRWPYNREDRGAHLSEAILDLATHNVVLNTTGSTIFVFVNDRNNLKPEAVNASQVVVPKRSTLDERKRVIGGAVLTYNAQAAVGHSAGLEVAEAEIEHVADVLSGLNLDQTNMAVSEVLNTHQRLNVDALSKLKAELLSKAGEVRLSEKPNVDMTRVGGYGYLKDAIMRRVILPTRHPNVVRYYRHAFKPTRGILLAGPPGTGKSLFAAVIANALDAGLAELSPEMIRGSLVGESERKTRAVLQTVEAAEPVIVNVDEAEAIFRRRAGGALDSGVSVNTMGMFLTALDNPKRDRRSIWVLTTNLIRNIDPAILRPGRIDDVFYVGRPDDEAREAIFHVHLTVENDIPLEGDIDLKELAGLTLLWSGAEIKDAVKQAIQLAGGEMIQTGQETPLGMRHLRAAIAARNVDKEARIKEELALLEEVEPFASDKEHIQQYRAYLEKCQKRLTSGARSATAAPPPPSATRPARLPGAPIREE